MFETRFNFFEVVMLLGVVSFSAMFWIVNIERRRTSEREAMQREINDLRIEIKSLRSVVTQHFPNELGALNSAL